MSESNQTLFAPDTFAVVEVMGHNTFAGKVSEHVVGGTAFIRVDVPAISEKLEKSYGGQYCYPAVPAFTKLIGASSIYAITPCTEEVALRMAARRRSVPVEVLDVSGKYKRLLPEPQQEEESDEVPI